MPSNTLVLMTVGKSLIDQAQKLLINKLSQSQIQVSEINKLKDEQIAKNYGDYLGTDGYLENFFRAFKNSLDDYSDNHPEVLERIQKTMGFPSAEIQSFCFWLAQQKAKEIQVGKIILLPTKTEVAKDCAKQIKSILNNYIFTSRVAQDKIIRQCPIVIESFRADPSETEIFAEDMAHFLEMVNKLLDTHDREFPHKVLNITGGYKVLAPLFTLYGFQREDVKVIYQHEDAKLVLDVPPLPMAWDFKTLDEYRSLVRRVNLTDPPPPKFRAFFTKIADDMWVQSPFGKLLVEIYDRDRLRRFGYGARLIRHWLLPKNMQDEIENRIARWEHIWIGDQIPETVEHSRGHSQRLMEYAAEILEPCFEENPQFLSSDELYCLICCLWLHDIGHTNLEFILPDAPIDRSLTKFKDFLSRCGLNNTGINNSLSNLAERRIRIASFPSLVREFHNFLSTQRICHPGYNYLPPNERDAVAIVSMYHRGKMPLTENAVGKTKEDSLGEKFGLLVPSLESLIPENGLSFRDSTLGKDKALLLAALLGLIDGLDLQSDRIIDQNYWKERKQRTQEEIDYYLKMWEEKSEEVTDLPEFMEIQKTVHSYCKSWHESNRDDDKLGKDIGNYLKNKLLPMVREVLDNPDPIKKSQWLDLLSLTDRLLFKMTTEAHFRRHSLVKFVYVARDKLNNGAKAYNIYMTFSEDYALTLTKNQKEKIAEEIWKEVVRTSEVLQKWGIIFNGIFESSGEQLQPMRKER